VRSLFRIVGFIAQLILLPVLMPVIASAGGASPDSSGGTSCFEIRFNRSLCDDTLDGRLLVIISTDTTREPRFQVRTHPSTQQVFGTDVESWAPGSPWRLDSSSDGYPLETLSGIPPGEYRIQALIHIYETFHRQDGHVVKLPMDRGEGQRWNRAPGNLYSTPRTVRIDWGKNPVLPVTLDRIIPPLPKPADTRYVRHITLQSPLLSAFWGRPMYLGAIVLLPEGYEDHPEARYPLMIHHDHFARDFSEFREQPPEDSSSGNRRRYQEWGHHFYRAWTTPGLPRMVILKIQHANPYYDDSYAVNSANVGPYGDAITYELIPEIEKQFRCIGKPFARFLYGGSTGGWAALAAQVFYPDAYNGCWAGCPDPVDFRGYQIVNIYKDENAYFLDGPWRRTQRPAYRSVRGEIFATVRDENYLERALGSRGRSGGQWDIWQAVFSPVGEEGYPLPIWDKETGVIDRKAALYWKENYDLRRILERDWEKLGPRLKGKIHITVGDMDNFHLNNAVALLEEFLENTTDPYYGGTFEYGRGKGHCWMGEQEGIPEPIHLMFIKKAETRLLKTAPAGADTSSWRY
jgi:hypothetical protein